MGGPKVGYYARHFDIFCPFETAESSEAKRGSEGILCREKVIGDRQ